MLIGAYSQEIGRAGRDNLPSKCVLYLCGEDWKLRETFCRADLPSKSNVTKLLRELFSCNEEANTDDVIEANHSTQSKDHDINVGLPFVSAPTRPFGG
jgi:superfamily II DNA helicase RecQ